jgi:hypothetical protein
VYSALCIARLRGVVKSVARVGGRIEREPEKPSIYTAATTSIA